MMVWRSRKLNFVPTLFCWVGGCSRLQLHERAELVPIKTVDPSMPPIANRCIGGNFARADIQRRAAERLRQVELGGELGLVDKQAIRLLGVAVSPRLAPPNRRDGLYDWARLRQPAPSEARWPGRCPAKPIGGPLGGPLRGLPAACWGGMFGTRLAKIGIETESKRKR
jgi:hypothetical protein